MEPTCHRHPDRRGIYYCAKKKVYLCEECLQCQDPTLYCKDRTMCMIWEVLKHGTPDQQEKKPMSSSPSSAAKDSSIHTITFLPSGKTARVKPGTTLTQAAQDADVYLNARCGGKGVCGSCKVTVQEGAVDAKESVLLKPEDVRKGVVLACTATVNADATILVPEETKAQALQIESHGKDIGKSLLGGRTVSPFVSQHAIEIAPPTIDDPTSDLDRVTHALKSQGLAEEELTIGLDALRELAQLLRQENWKVTVTLVDHGCRKELIRTAPYNTQAPLFGIALDMGTTSVVAYLVNLLTGEVLGQAATQNQQVVSGEDVITRIIAAKNAEGLRRVHRYGINTVNQLVDGLCKAHDCDPNDLVALSAAGNTVMTQLLLKLDPSSIRYEPYVPTCTWFPLVKAQEIGIKIHSRAAVYVVPGNAAYVGGDITAGIVSSGLHQGEETTLFIDVGTNGEMVLGSKDWLMTAACSAGPAFEGGGIRHGTRALPGAVEKVTIDPQSKEPTIQTIGDLPANGICGSGMISLIGELMLAGIIDTSGKFNDNLTTPRVRQGDFGMEYVLVWEKDAELSEDILLSEADIDTLLRSKAAVFGGIMTLVKQAGFDLELIDRFWVAGGFGRHIEFDKAILFGMLPDIPLEKFTYLGNSSVAGSYLALVNREARNELRETSRAMTYVDFSSSNLFFDEYQQAMFLPHTDMRQFPSVKERLKG